MITNTDLANRALAHIGEMRIADIDDVEDKAARACKDFIQEVIDESLQAHRWNCAIDRATLSVSLTAPNHGFTNAFALPADYLRLLELNGEQFDGSEEFFEIEAGNRLLTDSTEAKIRYVKRITVDAFHPLLAKAVAAELAAAICIPLNRDANMKAQCEALAKRAIGRAQQIDAIEVGSREVRPIQRLIENSPLVRARGGRRVNPGYYRLP